MSIKIVAEIGINHNGNIRTALDMIDIAVDAGCDYVKFQKRNVELVYKQEYLDKYRESPWGITNREQKNGLEFGLDDYTMIDDYCHDVGIGWFASPWDFESVKFLTKYRMPYIKVASPCMTNVKLLKTIRDTGIPVILSTGMITEEEFCEAVKVFWEDQVRYILVCTSTYPTPVDEMNLSFIQTLKNDYTHFMGEHCPYAKVGFSNHSSSTTFCIVAAALGAEMIEFHITLDRSRYGSDQAASIEKGGVMRIVENIRDVEKAMGNKSYAGKWHVFESEKKVREKFGDCMT